MGQAGTGWGLKGKRRQVGASCQGKVAPRGLWKGQTGANTGQNMQLCDVSNGDVLRGA